MSDIFRRDPRREWILRNRLHPEHQQLAQPSLETRGPSGLLRKNPHAVGFIGPSGIKRIDRLNVGNLVSLAGRRAAAAPAQAELPLHRVEQPEYVVAVVPDMPGGRLSAHDKDVIGQAHALIRHAGGAGAVLVITFGEHREEGFCAAGADRLLAVSGSRYEGYAPEQRTHALAQVEREIAPRYWLFPDSVAGGFELGCRLSARLGERPATRVWRADSETCISRAASSSLDITRATPRVLLLAEECAEPVDETRHEALPMALGKVPKRPSRIEDCGSVAVDPGAVPLAEAEFILSAGNGIRDWPQFHRTADALGATEGASRVAVDDGHMPRARQVGATGTWVTARVYIAVGISGAVQHLQGIGQCEKVIAVNTDPGCDMVKRAALSVIADSSEILAALEQLVLAHRKEELHNAA